MKESTLKKLRVAAWILLGVVFFFPPVDLVRPGSPARKGGFVLMSSVRGYRVIRHPQWFIQLGIACLLITLSRRCKGSDHG